MGPEIDPTDLGRERVEDGAVAPAYADDGEPIPDSTEWLPVVPEAVDVVLCEASRTVFRCL